MANIYVRSTDGSNSDNGSTWALAKATIAGADVIDGVGDSIWLSQSHSESTGAGNVNLSFAGTNAAPTRILCGNDAAEPPTALATTAQVVTTGANDINFTGAVYVYGIKFSSGTGSGGGSITLNNTSNPRIVQKYESCSFTVAQTASTSGIVPCGADYTITIWRSCDVKFAATGQGLIMKACRFRWNGGSLLSGGTSPSVFLKSFTSSPCDVLIENVDLSNCSTAMVLCASTNLTPQAKVVFRNIKLPASWVGTVIGSAFDGPGVRIEVYNADSGATNYKLWIEDYFGTIRDETTLVRTGGASDGTTALAWKMVSSSAALYPSHTLASPEIAIWNNTTGGSKTVTVDILRDSATNLKDNEVWLEVNYLGDAASPKGTMISDVVADVVTTAADQASSAATWTTTGMSNPNKQKLSVTFTPQQKGFYIARVILAKASTTLYVDPKLTIS